MADVTITPSSNGPLLVKGPVDLRDINGRPWPPQDSTMALCRCGGSGRKPFCDGTHLKIGFHAETKAPAT
ncbi:MAG: CDGSH iron-sulfur domain-containing protein [Thermaerobacter sp.]|nr:CDGSH iron-sulfur domain-containing protein [Thermaerobacter sp.]